MRPAAVMGSVDRFGSCSKWFSMIVSERPRVDHEFKKIAVRIPNIDTRAGLLAASRAVYWTYFDRCAGAIQHRLERGCGPIPHKAQIAAWRPAAAARRVNAESCQRAGR